MTYVFKTPDLGEGTTQAEIVEWRVKVGDFVNEDQPIADLMTDKATVEVSSPVRGTVVALRGQPGETMAVGSELVVFDVGGRADAPATVDASASSASAHAEASASAHSSASSTATSTPPPSAAPKAEAPTPARRADATAAAFAFETRTHGEKPAASPAVRRRATELGVPLTMVAGSGPAGRILREDLDAFVAAGGAKGLDAKPRRDESVEEIPIIGLRRKIAERMQDAKRRIPHIAYVEELDVTALEELRAHLNAQGGPAKLSLLPFLMRAIVRACAKFPQVNALFDDSAGVVRRYKAVHIGIATQTPSGLVVPVVRHAETLDVWESARELARLADAARANKATREELSGSTITISSLGALGGIVSTPVINAPEVAIVGVNKIVERPIVLRGQIVVRKMMNLSSSFDHRIVDGWDAASFIQAVKTLLEQPALLFMDDPRAPT
jgi:2-oxoisovalerate dehydrogenase E2 component (dihydrolipoyl transacylase)